MQHTILWIPLTPDKQNQITPLIDADLFQLIIRPHHTPTATVKDLAPQLLLLDMGAHPEMVLERIHEASVLIPETEIIVIASPEYEAQAHACLQSGAADVIFTPLAGADLRMALTRHQRRICERNQKNRFARFFHDAPCYITIQDRDCNIRAVNERFQQDFGIRPGLPCSMVYRDDPQVKSGPCPNCPLKKTYADGKTHQSEMTLTDRHGEEIHLLVWTAPIRDAEGAITEVMVMSSDITQLQRQGKHLSNLGLMISTLSHSVKGLLTGLDGGIYLMESGLKRENPEDIDEGFEAVKHIAGRIRSLVLDILFYAKERPLDWERVDGLNFIEDIYQTMAPKIRVQGIRFIQRFDPVLSPFEVDAGIFRTAMLNLLENAIDACMADTGKEAHTIEMTAAEDPENRSIVFTVCDNGIGIDDETRKKMFTIFFSSKGRGGTGLGLFITSRIIKQHGGDIHVQSAPNVGTTFTIRMPKDLSDLAKSLPDDGIESPESRTIAGEPS